MLTLKQHLEALLVEAAKSKSPKPTKPIIQPVVEPEEVDDSEDDYILKAVPDDAGIIDREAMLVKGEVPEEEEDLPVEVEEVPDFASDNNEEEEDNSTPTKGAVDWAKARNEPDTLRRFINFFLNKPTESGSESLNKDLAAFIEEGFDPDRNGPFKAALDEILIFYTDFRRSLINKEPTGIIVNLLQELSEKEPTDLERERWDPESDDPHLAKDNAKALKTLEKSFSRDARSITRWINKSQATSESIDDLTKDDLDNLFIAVNISNNYLYYKYENMAQWEKRYNALMRQDKKKAKNKKDDDEEEEIDYAPGEGLAIPHEDTKIFMYGFDPEKGQDPSDQTYFFTNYFRSLYTPSTTALKKFANSNSGALHTITKFLGPIDPKLISEMNLSKYAHALLGEANLVGDVGDKDILFGQFCSEITVWMLVALLFGEPKDAVFGKAIVRALKTVSYLSQAGLTSSASSSNAPQINSMDAKNPETGAYNSEDIGSVNAVTGAPDQELTLDKLIYDKFWDTLVALANVFNIGKNPSNLTRTIADTFAKVPVDAFAGDCEYYKVDSAGSITPANLLGEYQSFAGDVTKDSEYLVRELGAILSFLRGRDLFSERDITEKMKGLPKTFEDGLKAFNFSPSGISEDTNNEAANYLNELYAELCDHAPRFRSISPGLGSTIKREYLLPTSEMSEYFGITPVDPNATSVVDVPDARRDQVALKNRKVDLNSPEEKQKADLKQKFEDYYSVVSDMLKPPSNMPLKDWGFLHLTPLSIDRPSEAWEKQFVMYPIYDDKGNDITRVYGRKHLVIFPDAVSYGKVAKNILEELRRQEPTFLAAKTPENLEAALAKVCSVIPADRMDMLSFRSPLTISYPDKKTQSLPLAFLISPKKPNASGKQYGAMVPALYNKPIGVLKNPGVFAIFAAETLKVNNLVRTSTTPLDDGRIKSYIDLLVEADAPRYTVSPKLVPFAIMNIHLRAKTLIAVSELFDKINRVLETFRRLIDKVDADQAKIALAILPHHEKHEAGDDMVDILTTAAAKSLAVPEGFDVTEIEDQALAELNDTFKESNTVLDTARELRDKVKTMKFGSIRVKS